MEKKSIVWLFNELPKLVTNGILTKDAAENLRHYYEEQLSSVPTKNLLTVFAVLGFLLIALGIVLILAHNWEDLTRPLRLGISVGGLILAQLFAGFSLYFKRGQNSFTESSAVFLTVMIGASIALVGQTYHLADDINTFLLSWILLALPLIYLLRSTAAAVLSLALILFWTWQTYFTFPTNQLAWLFLLFILPFYKNLWQRSLKQAALLGTAIAFFLPLCFAAVFQDIQEIFRFIYLAFFAVIYLADSHLACKSQLWQTSPRPFHFLGRMGIIATAFVLTFTPWYVLEFDRLGTAEITLAIILTAAFAILLAKNYHRLNNQAKLLSLAPLTALLAYAVVGLDLSSLFAKLIFNIYLLALSLSAIVRGVAKERLALLNSGMVLLSALIIARFFDYNISFVLRGTAFILLGLGLLFANIIVLRRIKRKKDSQ